MFNWKNFDHHKNIFSQGGAEVYTEKWGQHHIDLRPKDLLRWIELCREDLAYLTLVDIACAPKGRRAEVVYTLFNLGSHQRVNLHVHVNHGEVIPSIVDSFVSADWMEREQAELFGLQFDRDMAKLLKASVPYVPEEPPALRYNPNKTEPPYPEESYRWKHFGILAPETGGNFEAQICFDPIKVVTAKINIGFHYQNFEKMLEGKDPLHVVRLLDQLDAGSAPAYACAWAKTIEDMLRIKIPERAQAIRIVMLEMARLSEHLTVLFEMTYALKKDEFRLFLDCREKIAELYEKYCGQRVGHGIIRIGGVRDDLPHGWISEFQTVFSLLTKNLVLIQRSLLGQNDFRGQLSGAEVSAQTALKWGVGGPAMRACGLNFDLRKSQPLYFYQDIDFDVPVGIYGTAYDRYLIRYEEIHQSLRIITQVLDNLPLGDVLGPPEDSLTQTLGLSSGSWHYGSLEAPNGEAGFLFFCSDDGSPARIKIKSPSFTLAQGAPVFLKGLEENQLQAAIASLGIRRLELDR